MNRLLADSVLIEAAGNTLEAYATVHLYRDMIDMRHFAAIQWLRNKGKPFVERQMEMGKI